MKFFQAIIRFFSHPIIILQLFNAEGCREPRRHNLLRGILRKVVVAGDLDLSRHIAWVYLGRELSVEELEIIRPIAVEDGNLEVFLFCVGQSRSATNKELEAILAVKVREGNRQEAESAAGYIGRGLRPEEKQTIIQVCLENGRALAAAYSVDTMYYSVSSRYWR